MSATVWKGISITTTRFEGIFIRVFEATAFATRLFGPVSYSDFNLEDTRLRDRRRIARLLAVACIALVWAYSVGEHKDIYVKPIRNLKHGRRAKSLVKHGIEEISNVLFRPTYAPKFDVFNFFVMHLILW